MKIIIILLFILISFSYSYAYTSVPSISEDEINYALGIKPKMDRDAWNIQDTILELGFLTIAGIDLWQTYTFLYIDKSGTEQNSYMGSHPSKKRFFGMAVLWGISHPGIAYAIPKRWLRTTWQLTFIVVHLDCVMRNYEVGVRIGF